MFACLECGRKFRTANAAHRASMNGCPKCGGVDIDLDTRPSQQPQVSTIQQCLALKLGGVLNVSGHRVERVAAGWMVDERFTASAAGLAECLASAEPCLPVAPTTSAWED